MISVALATEDELSEELGKASACSSSTSAPSWNVSASKRFRLPAHPDALADPKRHLLELARRAARPVREDLLAERGAIAAQGLGYNARLCALVERYWNLERAAARSESLRRARARIGELAQSWRANR